ncbi:hypothetical protein D3C86_927730 [compost metagenome]
MSHFGQAQHAFPGQGDVAIGETERLQSTHPEDCLRQIIQAKAANVDGLEIWKAFQKSRDASGQATVAVQVKQRDMTEVRGQCWQVSGNEGICAQVVGRFHQIAEVIRLSFPTPTTQYQLFEFVPCRVFDEQLLRIERLIAVRVDGRNIGSPGGEIVFKGCEFGFQASQCDSSLGQGAG